MCMNNGIFSVTRLDTSHQSVREMTQGSEHQHQPPLQANKRHSTACHRGVCRWIWMHGLYRFWLLMNIGEQACMPLLVTEKRTC